MELNSSSEIVHMPLLQSISPLHLFGDDSTQINAEKDFMNNLSTQDLEDIEERNKVFKKFTSGYTCEMGKVIEYSC